MKLWFWMKTCLSSNESISIGDARSFDAQAALSCFAVLSFTWVGWVFFAPKDMFKSIFWMTSLLFPKSGVCLPLRFFWLNFGLYCSFCFEFVGDDLEETFELLVSSMEYVFAAVFTFVLLFEGAGFNFAGFLIVLEIAFDYFNFGTPLVLSSLGELWIAEGDRNGDVSTLLCLGFTRERFPNE